MSAARAREAARKARELTRRKSVLESASLPASWPIARSATHPNAKFSSWRATAPADRPRVAATAISRPFCPCAADPQRGKGALDHVLANDEIKSMITAFGCGVGEDFNLEKLRYHRIVCMTDADVDGSHIRILLLTVLLPLYAAADRAGIRLRGAAAAL